MVEWPGFPPPGHEPGAAAARPLAPADRVDGKLRCPDHPDQRVRTEVPGVLYRCAEEHDLAAPVADGD